MFFTFSYFKRFQSKNLIFDLLPACGIHKRARFEFHEKYTFNIFSTKTLLVFTSQIPSPGLLLVMEFLIKQGIQKKTWYNIYSFLHSLEMRCPRSIC